MKNYYKLFILPLFLSFTLVPIVFANSLFDLESTPTDYSIANKNFYALKNVLSIYESAALQNWQLIPQDKLLKLGSRNNSVLLLRQHLQQFNDLPGYQTIASKEFDFDLEEAVKLFQQRHGLKADGVVGKNTLKELNISPAERLKQIQINMQRWANLSSRLPKKFILINIPAYQLYLYDNNEEMLEMKIIVGKPTRPTPELRSTITTLIFNPYWNVPSLIAQKDIVPKVLADPDYLTEMHIRVFTRQDEDAREINPNDINWEAAAENGFRYHFRQDPGNDNALGLVKFEFQNSHDVYLHDTPAKNLFDQEDRMFSSGCIRLEDPFRLVNYLMQSNADWSDEALQELIDAGQTKYLKVPHPMPIFITYITAWVDDNGSLNFRDDIYQKDE